MALSQRLESKINAPSVGLPFVLPGEARATVNYQNGRRELIIVESLLHDLGGNVYITDELEALQNNLIPPHLLREADRVDYIPPGGSFSTEVVTKKRKKYELVVRHVGRFAYLLSAGERRRNVMLPDSWDYKLDQP